VLDAPTRRPAAAGGNGAPAGSVGKGLDGSQKSKGVMGLLGATGS